jgi:IS1 family transposase
MLHIAFGSASVNCGKPTTGRSRSNRLTREQRAQILRMLCEGQSIRAITRITGASKNTVAKLLVDAGIACAAYQDRVLRNLPCKKVQVDEIWAFVYSKRGNVKHAKKATIDAGDVWTWTALCADTKLLCSIYVGDRSTQSAVDFLTDLKDRLTNRIQLTSDSWTSYGTAVDEVFGRDVGYGMIQKTYSKPSVTEARRYSPAHFVSCTREMVKGNPEEAHISTSYVERQNLTMRMHMRRFTRLTNAFSKKIENHFCAVALHAMYYNFVRIHKTLRVTPAMAGWGHGQGLGNGRLGGNARSV